MYLKKIEIAGFKSFADRTVIEFDQGLTAVVGPNGSGKSNITEAIRWVLGEQSAKNLRGGKMPDIIFSGTDIRNPLNVAEVTVVLDNQEHFLPLDFSEISVTRRLYRSGESEFYLNKQSCRLKDIVDLFMDSGLGKESFSIISQGKVEAIFNSKPGDRRGIFEEAAGVLKYKQRKKKAEHKLFETEDNLDRVQDIVHELEGQLLPLKEQSATAEHFLTLKEQFTQLDIAITVQEIQNLQQNQKQEEQAIAGYNQKLNKLNVEMDSLEKTLVDLRQSRTLLDAQMDQEQATLLQLTEQYEQAEGQKNVLSERSKNTLKSADDYQEQLESTREKLELSERESADLEKKVAEKTAQLAQFKGECANLEKEVLRYSKSTKEQLEEMRSEYVEIMQAQATTGNELKYLEKQYQQETSKSQKNLDGYEALRSQKEELTTRVAELEQRLKEKTTELEQLRGDYQHYQSTIAKSKQLIELKEKQMYDAMRILQQGKARQKSLQDLQENYAGFYQGVKAVLKSKHRLSGIVGAVAELIKVPKEIALAVETALGGSAQHVVVEDEKSARQAITFLKQQRLGRATFLPITTIKPRRMPRETYASLEKTSGFLGLASEKVTYNKTVQGVIQNLLGHTILAENLEAANLIAKQVRYQYRVVSLDGDIMNPGGSMTGGANKRGNQGNLFSQASELESLSEQVEKMEVDLTAREKQVATLKSQLLQDETRLEELRLSGENARMEVSELTGLFERTKMDLTQCIREVQAVEFGSKELAFFLKEYEIQKKELEKKQKELQEKREFLDQRMNQTDEEASQNATLKEQAQEKVTNCQAKVAVAKEQLLHLESLQKKQEIDISEWQAQVKKIDQQLQLLTSNSSAHSETHESLQKKMQTLYEQKADIQTILQTHKQEREQLHQEIAEQDQQLVEKNKAQQLLLEEKAQAQVLKDRAEVGLDTLLIHLQEEYQFTYEAAKNSVEMQAETLVITKENRKRLKQEMDELGPINLAAIEQFEEVSKRYLFLTTQRDDLLEAKDSLFSTMTEMDEIVKEKFSQVFDAISLEFQKVFPSMFGGGHAELRLTDPYDLLNTGVEIVAQPPGKKLQSLSLLSGGERALTAIALLFSIIQVRPVPFCILDEVEAALDEANVNRFGKYLSRFEDDTQFIVITHRRGTMEAADVLYGVTMQESGVSTIVSVRLEDVDKMEEKKES
ncbi:chromosome segregation protein SMC [Vagococcus entomophilus]|uniref:Chromosome partition protein Smc n=1 Tax=Vagococcus entomophilus TaxID=1160095 RepID=A0A430AFQ7_9ENTE|nr:chromosome segregation protein SMC [Vagococcus entomophilus]RSU06566.1 chromosome segregation protein SMC [Vagococcus entomophilus]